MALALEQEAIRSGGATVVSFIEAKEVAASTGSDVTTVVVVVRSGAKTWIGSGSEALNISAASFWMLSSMASRSGSGVTWGVTIGRLKYSKSPGGKSSGSIMA